MSDNEKILFAIDGRGQILPMYASGPCVEWHVYEDTEADWNMNIGLAGIPAGPGFFVWEGTPQPEYESADAEAGGGGSYLIGYEYGNTWRPLDQLEWLSLMEGVCPWSSRKKEEMTWDDDGVHFAILDLNLIAKRKKLDESLL